MKTRLWSEKMNKNGRPLIGQNKPFVGDIGPLTIPFVGKKIPSVQFRGKQTGFTLVELAITLLIIGILATWAVPAIRGMYMNNRMVGATNSLMADLIYARSEAVKRNSGVSVCASSDQATCSGSSNWSAGWIVFTDSGRDGAVTSGTDKVLRLGDGVPGITIIAYDNASPTPAATTFGLVFTAQGILNPTTTTGSGNFAHTLHLCDSRASSYGRTITVSTIGQPDFKKGC